MTEGEPLQPQLRLEDLDYELPDGLVAQTPIEPRDQARLLVFDRRRAELSDRRFADLTGLLRSGDVLVRNDTRVFPARSYFRRSTGGRMEVLFLCPVTGGETERWEALVRGRPRPGETLVNESLGSAWPLACERPLGEGRWVVANCSPAPVLGLLEDAGVTPLPPYIHTPLVDPERYQTTYACTVGSAAAPTAGLHFTPALDAALHDRGVTIEQLTLHVGLGTFKPLQVETLAEERLHSEEYEVDAGVWERLKQAHAAGRRVIAVGTTSLRVLEHLALEEERGETPQGAPLKGSTSLFVRPGFAFRLVDGLVTNFHLPRTSLLALVMAFCGVEETRELYRHAVAEGYRFYSFGDAMVAL